MKTVFLAVLTVLACSFPFLAQEHDATYASKPIELLPGMGDLHHPIATSSPQAQRFFDQGLTRGNASTRGCKRATPPQASQFFRGVSI